MPFVPLDKGCMVEVIVETSSIFTENTLWFTGTADFDATTLAALAAEIKTWWNTNMKPLIAAGFNLTRIRARAMDAELAPVVDYTTGLPIAGTKTGSNYMPTTVAAVVSFRTGYSGRTNRGRNFITGLTAADMSALNALSSTYISSLQTAYAALNGAVTANDAVHVVCSRRYQNAWRDTASAAVVTSYIVDQRPDSQRRRNTNVGL